MARKTRLQFYIIYDFDKKKQREVFSNSYWINKIDLLNIIDPKIFHSEQLIVSIIISRRLASGVMMINQLQFNAKHFDGIEWALQ